MASFPLVPFLFGTSGPVSARKYATAGVALAVVKYAVDAALIYAWTRQLHGPLLYTHPMLTQRGADLAKYPALLSILLVWTLPFLWIGLALTLRRTIDAGKNPWLAFLYFVPFVNYAWMLALCFLPTAVPTRPILISDPARPESLVRAVVLGLASSVA